MVQARIWSDFVDTHFGYSLKPGQPCSWFPTSRWEPTTVGALLPLGNQRFLSKHSQPGGWERERGE